MNKRKGFTLVELIITLAVFAILLGAVFITVSRKDSSRRSIDAASDQILADIRYARQRAISEGRNVAIKFYWRNNFYVIQHSPSEPIRTVYLPDGINICRSTGITTITYTPRGTPSRGDSIFIASEHYRARITVAVAGGRVELVSIERID